MNSRVLVPESWPHSQSPHRAKGQEPCIFPPISLEFSVNHRQIRSSGSSCGVLEPPSTQHTSRRRGKGGSGQFAPKRCSVSLVARVLFLLCNRHHVSQRGWPAGALVAAIRECPRLLASSNSSPDAEFPRSTSTICAAAHAGFTSSTTGSFASQR